MSNAANLVWVNLPDVESFSYSTALAIDTGGNIYVAGRTLDIFDGQTSSGKGSFFLTRLNHDGSKAWTRVISSGAYSEPSALAAGSDGSIYLSGFVEVGLEDLSSIGNRDAFVTRFNPDGSIVWTNLLVTSSSDHARALAVGLDGAIFVAGSTEGNLDGQRASGGSDAFLTKLNANGTKAWTRLFGGSWIDEARAVAIGNDGAIYVAGNTLGALDGQTYNGNGDAFLTKYRADGTRDWTRLLGTLSWDAAYALTIGADGAVYVAGYTEGSLNGQPSGGNGDAFLAKFSVGGDRVWTRLVGTSSYDAAYALSTGTDGALYMAGDTFGNLNGQSNSGNSDAYVVKYNAAGNQVWQSDLVGTAFHESATAVATGPDGAVYMAGTSAGDLDPKIANGGVNTSFLAQWIPPPTPPTIQFSVDAASDREGDSGSRLIKVEALLSAVATKPVTVQIAYSGTATLGSDYTNAQTLISIAVGQAIGYASFGVLGDTAFESNETIVLAMDKPTNASLASSTSFTYTILNDDESSTPPQTSSVFLPTGGYIRLGPGPTNVFGATGVETVVLSNSDSQVVIDQNVERVYLSESPSAYRFQQSGIRLDAYSATGANLVFSVVLQNDADGTELIFPGGYRGGAALAKVGPSGMRLGSVEVPPFEPGFIPPVLGAYVPPPDGSSSASVFLGQGANFEVANGGLRFFGAAGNEVVVLSRGVSEINVDQSVERVQFNGLATSALKFQQQGIGLLVYEGTSLLARVPVQVDVDGTLVTTTNGTMKAKVSAAGMFLGGALVSSAAAGTVIPVEVDNALRAPSDRVNVSVTGAGNFNAATGDLTFNLATITSGYNYAIAGFNAGDRIVSPLGTLVTIADQTSFSDGTVSLQYKSGDNIAKITLTGLTTAQDSLIFGVNDLNTVFGAGSFS